MKFSSLYIKLYIYIYIYIYIWITIVKTLVSVVAILKRYVEFVIYKCWKIFDIIFAACVSYFRPYAETKSNGNEWKVCIKWIEFRSWFKPCGIKISSFIIQKFSHCFILPVDVVHMFLSCSMIINFQ